MARKRFITIQEKAKQLVKNGLQREEMFRFFDRLQRDIIEYIDLFESLGADQNTIWKLYKEWMEDV